MCLSIGPTNPTSARLSIKNDTFLPGPPENLPVCETAFFFDFDGTLAQIVENPSEARIESAVLSSLQALHGLAGGALAIISGREVADLDARLSSFRPAAAGVHGLEWRLPDGSCHCTHLQVPDTLLGMTEVFAARHDGVLVEIKRGALSLHYRKRPDLAGQCLELACRIAARWPAVQVIDGKMVVEFKMGGRTKGDALAMFMSLPPFAGRRPVFVGDDTTDEAGFERLKEWDGISVKIGGGHTHALYRLPDTASFHRWLARIAER